jgi:hypothetical protein
MSQLQIGFQFIYCCKEHDYFICVIIPSENIEEQLITYLNNLTEGKDYTEVFVGPEKYSELWNSLDNSELKEGTVEEYIDCDYKFIYIMCS